MRPPPASSRDRPYSPTRGIQPAANRCCTITPPNSEADMPTRAALTILIPLLLMSPLLRAAEPVTPAKKIVLIAGKKSHGPEGNGQHDYNWSARLLKTALDHSNIKDQIQVEIYLN